MMILKTQIVLLLLLALGFVFRKSEIIKKTDVKAVANLLYYLFIPSLFFNKLANMNLLAIKPAILIGSLVPILLILLVLLVLKIFSVISREKYLLMSLLICFSSNTFFGIPFFTNLYGTTGQEFAVITSMFLGVFGIITTLVFFELAAGKGGKRKAFLSLLTNPILISIAVGVIFSLLKIRIALINELTASLLPATNGLAIILLGMFIHDNFNISDLKTSLLYAVVRLLVLPLATIPVILLFFGQLVPDNRFLIIQSGIPIAISTAVFAAKYEWKKELIGNIVIITSILSFVMLSLLYVFVNLFIA